MEVVNDLQLRQIRQFRVSKGLPDAQFGRKLVAVNSTYGFAVIAGTDGQIHCVWTKTLEELQAKDAKECDDFSQRTVLFHNENAKIFALEFNADGRVLAVVADSPAGPFVYLFDATTFSPDYQQQPFPLNSSRLSDGSAQATAFEWNPAIPEVFAVASTKTLTVVSFNIENHTSISIVGSKEFSTPITVISWSPKGKQVTVGDNDGRVHQLKPEIALVRTVDAPSSIAALGAGPYRCVGICWVSTTEWIVTYASNSSNSLHLSLLTVKKNRPPQWDNWPVLPPTTNPSAPKAFNFLPVFDWNLVLMSSTCLPEVPVIGAINNVWKPWELTEPFFITTPMADGKDTFVVGASLDLTSTKPVVVAADGSSIAPSPIVYVYTSDGLLLLYHLASLNPARPSLQKLVQPVSALAVKNGIPPANYKPRSLPNAASAQKRESTTTTSNIFAPAKTETTTPTTFSFGAATPKAANEPTPEQMAKLAAEQVEKERKCEADRIERERAREAAAAKAEAEKKATIAKAEAEKKAAEEAAIAKKKKELDDAHRAFKTVLDSVVSKLNEYGALTTKLSTLRRGLEIGIQEDLSFEQNIEPLFKTTAQVGAIGTEVDERLQRARAIVDAVNASSKEARNLLSHDADLPAADWVFELSDDLDSLVQRHYDADRKYQEAEKELKRLTTLLKEGKLHIRQPATLTQDEQNYVNRDSLVISRYVNDLTKRLSNLRKTTRTLYSSEPIRRTRDALKKAGGINESLLEQSSFFDNSQSLNASCSFVTDTPELLSNLSLNDNNKPIKPKRRIGLDPARASKMAALITALENAPPVKPVKVKLVHVEDVAVKPERKGSLKVPTPNPKIVETRKALQDTLQTLRTPRKKLEPISAQVTPRTPLNSNQLLQSVAPPPQKPAIVEVVEKLKPKPDVAPTSIFGGNAPTSGAGGMFGNKFTLFGTKPGEPVVPKESDAAAKKTDASPAKPVVSPVAPVKMEAVSTPPKPAEKEEAPKPTEAVTPEKPKESPASTEAAKTTPVLTAAASAVDAPVSTPPTSTTETKPATTLPGFSFAPKPAETTTATSTTTTTTPAETKPATTTALPAFSFKPKPAEATTAAATTATTTTTTAAPAINFSFKPQQTTAPSTQEKPAAPATNAFGQPAATEAPAINFSFKPASPPTSTAAASAFGGAATAGGSAFGGTGFGNKSAFGAAATPATQSAFGSTGTSAFGGGSPATGTSAFGGATATSGGSAFGGGFSFKPKETAPATNTSGGFGTFAGPVANATANATAKAADDDGMEDDSATGGNATANSMSFSGFGLGCSPNPANANKNPFGSATPSSTDNSSSWMFGNKPAQQSFFSAKPATTSAFGSAAGTTSAFGSGGGSAFGSAANTTTTSAFGSGGGSTGGSAFGGGGGSSFGGAFAQNKSAFGSTGSAFGGAASPFAQNTNKPSSFGGATGAPTMGSGFASFANKSGGFSALAQQATPAAPSAFGGNSAFSQQPKSTNNAFSAWRS
uniref:Nuclear pore complex protein Nup214 n=1 Tax=Panagrellus redivivus TaxID=6233 RepID=A0A7E4V164_PANRE